MSGTMVWTVLVADDHPVVLQGLCNLIDRSPNFRVIAAVMEGQSALSEIRSRQPDIAVLDLAMPNLSGIEVIASLRAKGVSTHFVLLTAAASDSEIYEAVAVGADGILFKESTADTLMGCLQAVAGGGKWLLASVIAPALERETQRRTRWREVAPSLTEREMSIVRLVLEGHANKEIAYQLDISEGTTKVHLNRIFRKLGVFSRRELLDLAVGLSCDRM